MDKIFFFSDNTAAVHPTIMQALVDGNKGHGVAYGLDDDAKRVNEMFKEAEEAKKNQVSTDVSEQVVETDTNTDILDVEGTEEIEETTQPSVG